MALLSCIDCDKEISPSLETCPHCGRVMPKEFAGLLLRAAVGIGLVLLLLRFCPPMPGHDEPSTQATHRPHEFLRCA